MTARYVLLSLLAAFALIAVAPVLSPAPMMAPAWADDDDDDGDNDDDDDDRPRRRAELIVSGLSENDAAVLVRRGYLISRTVPSNLLEGPIRRILAPAGLSANAALRAIRQMAPNATAARNDRYIRSPAGSYRPQGRPCEDRCPQFVLTGWTQQYLTCTVSVPIGIIDTRVDGAHPALAGAEIEHRTVRRADRRPSDSTHGTSVVSLLVGQPGTNVVGLVPRARIVAVDPFHRAGNTDATDAFDLVAALDVLADRNVRVINMSLSGPGNPVLERGIRRLLDRGTTIVAAAGTVSAAGSGYPARYEGVVAVAAVDAQLKPSRLSARGPHIAYAGPGVGIAVAAPNGLSRLAAGTSFAAPFVSAAVAIAKSQNAGADSAPAIAGLRERAKDLGTPGRDPIFGWGLIQFPPADKC